MSNTSLREKSRGRGAPTRGDARPESMPSRGMQGAVSRAEPATHSVPPPQTEPPGAGGDATAAVMKGIKDLSLIVPRRDDLNRAGTKGAKIKVETNHLILNLDKLMGITIVHYDVAMEPDSPKRLLRLAMQEFQKKNYPGKYPAFDGKKNLYSSGYLPFGMEKTDEVQVTDDERGQAKTYKITVKFASTVDPKTIRRYLSHGSSQAAPQEAIQAVDIVLRSAAALSFTQVGRSFFSPPTGKIIDLGDGLELWYGFYQSAILGWKVFVNIDVAHKGFPKPQSVIDLIRDLNPNLTDLRQELKRWEKDEVQKFLKGLKIDYQLPGQPNTHRTYRVNGLMPAPGKLSFPLDDGRTVTVKEYFEKEKHYMLKFPEMPCLHVGSATRAKPIYVPSELCSIVRGQVIVKKMNELQTSSMIRQAATSTIERKRKIVDSLKRINFNGSPCVKEFGLSVSNKFEIVDARILEPPELSYRTQTVHPQKGVWRASEFLTGSELLNWTILNLARIREDDLRSFAQNMAKFGRNMGMNIQPPARPVSMDAPRHDNTKQLEAFMQDCHAKKMALVVVVVPDKGDTYPKVKQVAELTVGVLTQCVKARTMRKMNPSTVTNILLKVNSKLNGVNHSLFTRPDVLKEPVMIVGADVTHPSPDQNNIPSVAAVAASHDPKAFRYNIQYRFQQPREEIIQDLETIMRQQLMFFFKNTRGLKPKRIIFYRDGVSEGQFAQVLNMELMAIRRACMSLNQEYQPMITFMVVQKRHHTRFFPTRREDEDGVNKNVPPGTIVDTDITHPTELDFYLVSHASIQGVSRPTKYRRLWDDSKMSEDQLEQLTYYLCHLFSRCTRSVSYPAPTYYAHLMAYRARAYMEGSALSLGNLEQEQKLRTIKESIQNNSPMFFV